MNPEEFLQGGVATQPKLSFEEFSGGNAISVVEPKTEQEKLSFAQRFGEDLQKRQRMAEEISDAVTSGEQSFAEGVIQTAGKVGVGGAFDFIGQGLVSAFRAIPDIIEKPIRTGASAFLETDIAQAGLKQLEKGFESYNAWKATNPRAARNIESVVNIGIMFAPVRGKPKAEPTRFAKGAEIVETKAIEQVTRTRESFIDDLISPSQTKAVREAQIPRTTERGVLKTKVVEPSVAEKGIAQEVAKIEGISTKNSLQKNFNIINRANVNLAKKLESDIAKNDFIYPKKELITSLKRARTNLAENPLIVGDAEKTATKLLNKFEQFIQSETGKGSGILSARKKFDAWVKTQKGTNIFDPKNETALSIALREIRQTANDFLDKSAKDVAVKDSLKKQSTLFRALDNITPKASSEGANVLIRAWQNVTRVLPIRGEFNQILAVLFGLGGLGASAVFAPFFTKLVLGSLFTYGATKAVMSVATKKAISHLLKGIDTAIRTTKDANLIQQLRADRVLILEILNTANETETEESQSNESQETPEIGGTK